MSHWLPDIGPGPVLWSAFLLYTTNILVGLVAFFARAHFGLAHHVLYFVVLCSVVLALGVSREWILIGTLVCLGLLSRFPASSFWHPFLAFAGWAGLVAAVFV